MRILVVDNYAPFATSLRMMLQPAHEVRVAASGYEALDVLRDDRGFAVVFCDLLMPGVSGMDLYETLRRQQPGEEKKLVFMSGGSHTPAVRDFLARVPNARLDKPFSLADLEQVLAQVQSAPAP